MAEVAPGRCRKVGAGGTAHSSLPAQAGNLPTYTDIIDALVFIGTDTITASIGLADLPATLPINMASTLDYNGKYGWEVLFDNDGSGTNWSVGDVLFYFNRYKKRAPRLPLRHWMPALASKPC